MKIAVIDDEKLVLEETFYSVSKAIPEAEIDKFNTPDTLLENAKIKKYDVVFSDIQMPGMHGIQLAKELKKINPKVNIIFVTGYSDFKDDAIKVHSSGYLTKPVCVEDITEEMNNLLHPVEEESNSKIIIKTFGNFCVFVGGEPVSFRRDREEELLAYLVDRQGAPVSRKEISAIMFEESDFSRNEQVYLSIIAHDLAEDLEKAGAKGLFVKKNGNYRVNTEMFECDSYKYLDGDPQYINRFVGEYMEQYSWAEYLKGKFFD